MAEVKSCARCISSNNFVIVRKTLDIECAYCGWVVTNISKEFKDAEKKEHRRRSSENRKLLARLTGEE